MRTSRDRRSSSIGSGWTSSSRHEIAKLKRSVGEYCQLARLNQPLAIALDESILGAAHRGRDHRAVLVAAHGLPVRLMQGLAGFRERNSHAADDVIQIRCRQSLRLAVVAPLNEARDDLANLLAPFADVSVRINDRVVGEHSDVAVGIE